ncbi:MAG: MFS transporter [Alphaproteobacteria bacterium]
MAATPVQLLRHPGFRKIWLVGGLVNTMRWLEVLAIGIYVFDLTGSPLLVALMMFLRQLPFALFGAVVGAVADRFDRRHLLLAGLSTTTVVLGLLSLSAWTGHLALWQIGLGAFISGVYLSGEHAIRRTMLGEFAGTERIGPAMALDSMTNNSTRGLGPLIGGLMYQTVGLQGAYLLGFAAYLVSILLVLRVHYVRPRKSEAEQKPQSVLRNLIEGFQYARTNRLLLGVLFVTVIVNMFAFSYSSMVPAIGREELLLSAFAIGLMFSAEGLGSFLGAMWVSVYARTTQYNYLFFYGGVLFCSGVLLFSLSPIYGLSIALLTTGGFGFAGYASMQSAIAFRSATPEMRSRAMGLVTMFIGSGPFGVLLLGFLANHLGAADALTLNASIGMVLLLVTFLVWPEIRSKPETPDAS